MPATVRANTVPPTPSPGRNQRETDQIEVPSGESLRETERRITEATRATDERATLTFVTGLEAGLVYPLPEGGCVLGRAPGVEVVIDDTAVSRRHARIFPTESGFAIEDLQSANGTFVSGTRVAHHALTPGDRVQLGPNVVLRYSLVDGTEEALQRRLYESSTRDPLTGAFNRAYLGERLIAETAHARRHRTELAVLMIDLDGFKRINDQHGHLAGDAVLKAVAQLFLRVVRVEDVVARYGGEEFVVLLRATTLTGAVRLADRLREAVSAEQIAIENGGTVAVTISVGVASLLELDEDKGVSELLSVADARLYRAKTGGRDRVCSS